MLFLVVVVARLLSINANDECGVAKVFPKADKGDNHALYILEGETAPMGMFPWIGYLVYGNAKNYADCTVSLVKPQWLVTAAHCVVGECAQNAWVILGTVKRDQQLSDKNIYKVAYLFHPKTMAFEQHKQVPTNDIALIKLEREVDIRGANGTINTICLPKREQALRGRVYLSGWGLTAEDAINPSETLQYISADILQNATCFDDKTKFCVRGLKKSQTPYKGDSGGPAQMLINGKYYLHGALSGGNKTVSLYTTVKDYLDWIVDPREENTVNLNKCKTKQR